MLAHDRTRDKTTTPGGRRGATHEVMPELPEVETIRRGLESRLAGARIRRVEVLETRLRTPLSPRQLEAELRGRRIQALARRGKYLLLHLSGGRVLVFHLGMTGQLMVVRRDAPLTAHTHVRIGLEGGEELRYADTRRFGMLFVLRRQALDRHPRFRHLGPEPLGPEFTPEYLQQRARRVRKPIKNFLMDAAVVVGLGNIYATEALYRAGIHPSRASGRIAAERWKRLHAAILEVLGDALRAGGTTLQDYRNADGEAGLFQNRLLMYGRAGEACERCGRRIRRIVQAGRSTFYCPGCQR